MASDPNSRLAQAHWSEVAVLAGPALLLFAAFVLLPFALAVGFSFTNVKLLQTERIEWTGLDNYTRMFALKVVDAPPAASETERELPQRQWRRMKREAPAGLDGYQYLGDVSLAGRHYLVGARDPQFLRSIANTFLFALMVVPLQTALAFAMALWVNHGFRGRVVLRTVFFSPVVTSMVVVAAVWGLILHTEAGLANQLLRVIFGDNAPQPDWLGDPHLAMLSIAIMSAWQGAGFQMLIFLAGLQGISIDQYEAADVMGASRWQKFVYITLPGLKRTLVFVALSTTIMAFGLFTQVDVLTGGGPMDSTSTLIFHSMRVGFREQDIAYGSAMTLFFFVFVLLLSLGQKKLLERSSR
ncbi:sugar ABC transporter permease [Ideonella azotifigens]|uniref:Sugar ABC transporter permease n=1 Tax=Ideonella azotifigens TaxID=513160 RepID=A0ABP3VEJ6_9BURK|nr:sugar ABC transporter permease [Ideonella azotifigens]MCD2344444.1 sugar ABC transporter permease [Ideonella azotifigens]